MVRMGPPREQIWGQVRWVVEMVTPVPRRREIPLLKTGPMFRQRRNTGCGQGSPVALMGADKLASDSVAGMVIAIRKCQPLWARANRPVPRR